jgi:hypothetical protein
MRRLAGLIALVVLLVAASPKKKAAALPPPAAPDVVPHSIALFLGSLCKDGSRQITFRAQAMGTRFYLEEPTGVTVYRYDRGHYVKDEFLKGVKLAAAMKKHGQK